MRKKFFTFAICVMAMIVSSCGGKKNDQAESDIPNYELLTLKPQDRTINYSYPATLKGKDDIDIYPQVEGRIVSKNYTDGGFVRKGQVLFTIDPTTARLEVQTAQSNVKAAQAGLSTAKLEYESQKNLFDKGIVSAYVMQKAQNAYQTAQAQVAQTKANLAIAQTNLSHCTVYAPVSGIISGRFDKISALVSPSMADPLATVSDQSTVIATFSINEELYLSIFEETDVKNTADGPVTTSGKTANDVFKNISLKLKDGSIYPEKGTFKKLSGNIDRSTGSVSCEVHFPNPKNILHSGNTANIIFPCDAKNVLIVPQTACKKLQDKYLIYRVNKQGCAEGVVIDVAPTDDGKEYIVLNGLSKGDEIVANGISRIAEGQLVKDIK